MLLDMLNGLKEVPPPFATACLDATAVAKSTEDDVALRWAVRARQLEREGTPHATIEALAAAALQPTGRGGEHTRVLVASGETIAVDLLLPGRPEREESAFGPVPHLMPAARALSAVVPHAVVRVDRVGADVEVVGPLGDVAAEEEVAGEHDVLHKVPGGGWSQRRYQARVEDSWERNATAVTQQLERVLRRHRSQLVLIAGDDHVISMVEKHAGKDLAGLLVRLESGGRAQGVSGAAEQAAIEAALAEHRRARRGALLDRFSEQLSRQQQATEGLDDVVAVLRRGQVEELLLWDDPSSTAQLWVGEQALQLGVSRDDALAAGAADPVAVRADSALVWAVVASGAGITVLDRDDHPAAGGIAALLRWSDEATPHAAAPSMPGHGEPPGMTANRE